MLTLNTSNVLTSLGAKYIQKTVSYLNLLQISIYFHVSGEIDFFVQVNWLSSTHFSL